MISLIKSFITKIKTFLCNKYYKKTYIEYNPIKSTIDYDDINSIESYDSNYDEAVEVDCSVNLFNTV